MPSTGKTGQRLVAFEGWEAGEYGKKAPHRAALNAFTGLNVMRYENSLLGPRHGMREIVLTGASLPSGIIRGFGISSSITTIGAKSIWMVVGNKAFLISTAGVTVECTGTSTTTPTGVVHGVSQGDVTYVSGGGLTTIYKIDHAAATYTAVAGSPALQQLVQYGEVLMGVETFNTVRYSDASAPTSWPAGNFFRVGSNQSFIRALMPQREHLMIAMLDSTWWLLRGPLAQTGALVTVGSASLRKISDSVSPPAQTSWAPLGNGNIGYVMGSFDDLSGGDVSSLFEHNGSRPTPVKHIPFGQGFTAFGAQNSYGAVPLRQPNDWVGFNGLDGAAIPSGGLAVKARGTWSLHFLDPDGATQLVQIRGLVLDDWWFLTNGGAAATQPRLWMWQAYAQRPGFTTDPHSRAGDSSLDTVPPDAFFTTAEWLSDAGFEAKVQYVTIDFRSYTTGSSSSNHFDVQCIATKLLDRNDLVTSATQSFDDPAGSLGAATTEGKQMQRRFQFSGNDYGRGFKIKLSNIRGVAIERILVRVDVQDSRS